MIRINLLEIAARPGDPPRVDEGRRAALAGGGLLAGAAGLMLWQALSIRGESNRLDDRTRALDRELAGLAGISAQRDAAERRIADLAGRVALTESLRAAQGATARMLDRIGRVLPDGVWLTELRRQGDALAMEGRATGMTGLSDLVAGLESSGYVAPPVEIVESRLEGNAAGEMVIFELRMRVSPPSP